MQNYVRSYSFLCCMLCNNLISAMIYVFVCIYFVIKDKVNNQEICIFFDTFVYGTSVLHMLHHSYLSGKD